MIPPHQNKIPNATYPDPFVEILARSEEDTMETRHKPGPDERGNIWLECGCMVNQLMVRFCSLHGSAGELLKAAKSALEASKNLYDRGGQPVGSAVWVGKLRAAIAAAEK